MKENTYRKNSVIAIQSLVITTIIYALLAIIFLERDNVYGGETFVVNTDKIMTYSQQAIKELENECKSPCPKSLEMGIEMCA